MMLAHLRICVLVCTLQMVFSALILQRQPIVEPYQQTVGVINTMTKTQPRSENIKNKNTNVSPSGFADVSRQSGGGAEGNGLTSINGKALSLGYGKNLAAYAPQYVAGYGQNNAVPFAPKYVNGYGTQNARGNRQQYGAQYAQQNVAANRVRQQNIPQYRGAYGKNSIGTGRLQGQSRVKGGGFSKLQSRVQNPMQASMNMQPQIYRPLNQMSRTPSINGQRISNGQRVGNVNTYVPIGQVSTMGQNLVNPQFRYDQSNLFRQGYPQNAPVYGQNVPLMNSAMYQRPIYTNYVLPPLVRIPTFSTFSTFPTRTPTTTTPATADTTPVDSISMTTVDTNTTPFDFMSLLQFTDADFLGCTPDELAQLAVAGFFPSAGSGSSSVGLTGGLTGGGSLSLTGLTGALSGGVINPPTVTGGISGLPTGTGSVTSFLSPTGCAPTSVDLTGAASAVGGALGGVDLTGAANTLSNMLGNGCTGSTLDLQALGGVVSGLSGSLGSGTSLSGAASALGSALSGLSLPSGTGSISTPTDTSLLSGLGGAPTSLTGTVSSTAAPVSLSGVLSGLGGTPTGGIATGSLPAITGLLSGALSGIGGALTGVTGSVSSTAAPVLTGTCSALAQLNLGRR